MKIEFTKLKNLTRRVTFFWQTLVIVFFAGLLFVLIASAIFWFSLSQDFTSSITNSRAEKNGALDAKKINQVLEQIKIRSTELASTTANLPTMADPSR